MSTQRNCCCDSVRPDAPKQAACLGGDKFFVREGDVPHSEDNPRGYYPPNYGTPFNLSDPKEIKTNNGNSCMLCTNTLVQKNSNFPFSLWGTMVVVPGGALGLQDPTDDSVGDAPRIKGDHLAALDLYYGALPPSEDERLNLRKGLLDPIHSTYNFNRVISLNPSDVENPTIDFPIQEDQLPFKNSYLKKLEQYKQQKRYHVFNVKKKKRKLKLNKSFGMSLKLRVPYFTADKEDQLHVGLKSDYAVLDYLDHNNSLIFLFKSKEKRDEFALTTDYIDIRCIDSDRSQYRSRELSPVMFKDTVHGMMVSFNGKQDGSPQNEREITKTTTNERLQIVLWGYEGNSDPDIPVNIIGAEIYVNRSALLKETPPITNELIEIINPDWTEQINKIADNFEDDDIPDERVSVGDGDGEDGTTEAAWLCCCNGDEACGKFVPTSPGCLQGGNQTQEEKEECCRNVLPSVGQGGNPVGGGNAPCVPIGNLDPCPYRICCDFNYDSQTIICDCINTDTGTCDGTLVDDRSCGGCGRKITGACCLPDGNCDEKTADECSAVGGTLFDRTCAELEASGDCVAMGACCFCDGTCTDNTTQQVCEDNNGTFSSGESCAGLNSDPTTACIAIGACCVKRNDGVSNSCSQDTTEQACDALAANDPGVEDTSWNKCGLCPGSSGAAGDIVDCEGDGNVGEPDPGGGVGTNTENSGVGSFNQTESAESTNTTNTTNTTNSGDTIDIGASNDSSDPVLDVDPADTIPEPENESQVTAPVSLAGSETGIPDNSGDGDDGGVDVDVSGGANAYYMNMKTTHQKGDPIYTMFHHVADYWYFDWGRSLHGEGPDLSTPEGYYGIARGKSQYGADHIFSPQIDHDHFVPGWSENVPFKYTGAPNWGTPQMVPKFGGPSQLYGIDDQLDGLTDQNGIFNPVDSVDINRDDYRSCRFGLSNVDLICHPDKSRGMDARSVWSNSGTNPINEWGDANLGVASLILPGGEFPTTTIPDLLRSASSGDPEGGCSPSSRCPHTFHTNLSGYYGHPVEGLAEGGIFDVPANQGGSNAYTLWNPAETHRAWAFATRWLWQGNGIHSICPKQSNCLAQGAPFNKTPYQSSTRADVYGTRGKSGLSDWQVATMAADQGSRWLLDIMSYADAKPVFWSPFHNKKANLHDCLVGVMHKMRVFVRGDFWTESLTGPFQTCPDDPFGVCFEGEGASLSKLKPHTFYPPVVNSKMQASADGCQTCFSNNEDPTCPYKDYTKYCTTPKYWIYKCAGVPIFDFELWGLMLEGKLDIGDLSILRKPPHLNFRYTDNFDELGRLEFLRQIGADIQDIGEKLSDAGILDIRDWREEQRLMYRTWDQFLSKGRPSFPLPDQENDEINAGPYAGFNGDGSRIPGVVWGDACCHVTDDEGTRCDPEIDSRFACTEDNMQWKGRTNLSDPPITEDLKRSELLPIRKRSVVFIKDEDDIDFDPTDKIGLHYVTRDQYEDGLRSLAANGGTPTPDSTPYYDPTDLNGAFLGSSGAPGPFVRNPVKLAGKYGSATGIQPLTPDLINKFTALESSDLVLSGEMAYYNPDRYNKNPLRQGLSPRQIVDTNGYCGGTTVAVPEDGLIYPTLGATVPGTRRRENDPRWLPYPNENDYYDIAGALDRNKTELAAGNITEEEYLAEKERLEEILEEQKNLIRYYKIYLANNPIYLHARPGGWSHVPITRPTEFGLIGSIQPWDLLNKNKGGPYALLDFYGFENAPCWSHGGSVNGQGVFPSVAYPFGTQMVKFQVYESSFTGVPIVLPRANTKNPSVSGWGDPNRACKGPSCGVSSGEPCQPPNFGAPCNLWMDQPQIGVGPGGCAPGLSENGACASLLVTGNNYGLRIREKVSYQNGICPQEPLGCQKMVRIDEYWRSYYQETLLFPFDYNCVPSDLRLSQRPTEVPEPAPGAFDGEPELGEEYSIPDPAFPDRGDFNAENIVGCIERQGGIFDDLIPRPNNVQPEHDKVAYGAKLRENTHVCGDDPCSCAGSGGGHAPCDPSQSCPGPDCPSTCGCCCNREECITCRQCGEVDASGIIEYGIETGGPDKSFQRAPQGWYVPYIVQYDWSETPLYEGDPDGGCDAGRYICKLIADPSNVKPAPVVFGWGAKIEYFPITRIVPRFNTGVCRLPGHCPFSIAKRGFSSYQLDQGLPYGSSWYRCGDAIDGPPTPHDCYDDDNLPPRVDLQIKTLKRVKTDGNSRTLFLDELDSGNSNIGYPSAYVNPTEDEDAEDVEFYCSVKRSDEEFEETGIATDVPVLHWLSTSLGGFKEIRFTNIINPMEKHIRNAAKIFDPDDERDINGSPIGWRTFKDLELHKSGFAPNQIEGGPPEYPGWSPPELPSPVPADQRSDHGSPNASGAQDASSPYRFFELNHDEGRKVGAIIPFGGWFGGGRFLEPDTYPASEIQLDPDTSPPFRPKNLNEKVRGDSYTSDVAYIHWYEAFNNSDFGTDPCLQCDEDGGPENCLVQPGEICPTPVNPARGVMAGLPYYRYDSQVLHDEGGTPYDRRNTDLYENYGPPGSLPGYASNGRNDYIGVNNRLEAGVADEINREDLADREFRNETVLGTVLFVFDDFEAMYTAATTSKMSKMSLRIDPESCETSDCSDWPLRGRYELTNPAFVFDVPAEGGPCDGRNNVPLITYSGRGLQGDRYNDVGYYVWGNAFCDSTSEACIDDNQEDLNIPGEKYFPNALAYDLTMLPPNAYTDQDDYTTNGPGSNPMRSVSAPHYDENGTMLYDPCVDSPHIEDGGGGCFDPWCSRVNPAGSDLNCFNDPSYSTICESAPDNYKDSCGCVGFRNCLEAFYAKLHTTLSKDNTVKLLLEPPACGLYGGADPGGPRPICNCTDGEEALGRCTQADDPNLPAPGVIIDDYSESGSGSRPTSAECCAAFSSNPLFAYCNDARFGGWDQNCSDGFAAYLNSPDVSPYCTVLSCDTGVGSCCTAHNTPFCDTPSCCEAVCDIDPNCCEFGWDETCAEWARNPVLNEPGPNGEVPPCACQQATGACCPPPIDENEGDPDRPPVIPPSCQEGRTIEECAEKTYQWQQAGNEGFFTWQENAGCCVCNGECDEPRGACCYGDDGQCQPDLTFTECVESGGNYAGNYTNCLACGGGPGGGVGPGDGPGGAPGFGSGF